MFPDMPDEVIVDDIIEPFFADAYIWNAKEGEQEIELWNEILTNAKTKRINRIIK